MIEPGRGHQHGVERQPDLPTDLAAQEHPRGKRQSRGEHEVFANWQTEEIAEDFGEGAHRYEALIIDDTLIALGDHSPGDLGSAENE